MQEGKYFMIRSQAAPDMALELLNGAIEPCTAVVTGFTSGADTQVWYFDVMTGTIRNKANHLCLDLDFDKNIIVNQYTSNNKDHSWRAEGDKIVNDLLQLVLSLPEGETEAGVKVAAMEKDGGEHQKWTYEYQPAEYFWLKNKTNDHVLDISGDKEEPGVDIITYKKKSKEYDNQMWYQDKKGILRSKLGNFAMDAADEKCLVTAVYDPSSLSQIWVFHDGRIVNGPVNAESVLEVKGRPVQKRMGGAKVGPTALKKDSDQIWSMVYEFE